MLFTYRMSRFIARRMAARPSKPSKARQAEMIITSSGLIPMHRFDRRTGQSHVISPLAISSFGTPISKAKYRFTWTSPLAFSPKEPGVLYMGSQYLLKTSDHGLNWQPISPDLTGADPKAANATGPVTVENAKARAYGVIYTISPSPINAGMIWTGADTGVISITRDGGKSWSNVTPQGLADWSKISILEA